ncbi:tail fiber assembly protein [Pseudomonas sp. CJQ_7]|uniref:tail fiber assembly protein n=1 Tax=Pseudomonas sp. CJQ_7 TaxID=3367166 RepID=UPI003709CE41
MKKYARIENGVVMEQIETGGDISAMFPPELVWIDVTGVDGVSDGWIAIESDGAWSVSAPPQSLPSAAEILALNTTIRDQLLSLAAIRIAPLQDAVDLGDAANEEIALLKTWKQYRVSLNRIDLTMVDPGWPNQP